MNYLFNSSTGNAPTLQVIEYEYTFADWRSAELDLSYYNGNLEILTPFYQRTLGVGRRRNWVHGYQVSPDLYLRSGFVGGSAVYALGWKPEEESRFSSLIFLGANRSLIGGFHPTPPRPWPALRRRPATGSSAPGGRRSTSTCSTSSTRSSPSASRPTCSSSAGKAGEYLDFPFLTYKPGKHAFFQIGGGYYRFESRDQFTFLLHLNFVNPPTASRGRTSGGRARIARRRAPDPGRFRRCLDRILGDRGG